jgi:hypothetical protein
MNERSLLALLRRVNQPANEVALALVLTERGFRRLPERIVETLVALYYLYVRKEEPNLTMGECQVAFAFWRRRFKSNAALLIATFSQLRSYYVCCDYLSAKQFSSVKDLLVFYNGKPSHVYVRNFCINLQLIRRVILRYSIHSEHNPQIWYSANVSLRLLNQRRIPL